MPLGNIIHLCIYIGYVNTIEHNFKTKCRQNKSPRSSVEKVFLEILQNSQENIRARVAFVIKLQD